MSLIKKTVLGSALAATALVSATPAMARDRYRHDDNTAAVAVGAGILGVGLGVLLGSGNRGYDDGYRYDNGRWYDGYRYDNGWFYDRQGQRRYDRNSWDQRYRDGDRRGAYQGTYRERDDYGRYDQRQQYGDRYDGGYAEDAYDNPYGNTYNGNNYNGSWSRGY